MALDRLCLAKALTRKAALVSVRHALSVQTSGGDQMTQGFLTFGCDHHPLAAIG
jgi:hypothetical protein